MDEVWKRYEATRKPFKIKYRGMAYRGEGHPPKIRTPPPPMPKKRAVKLRNWQRREPQPDQAATRNAPRPHRNTESVKL